MLFSTASVTATVGEALITNSLLLAKASHTHKVEQFYSAPLLRHFIDMALEMFEWCYHFWANST